MFGPVTAAVTTGSVFNEYKATAYVPILLIYCLQRSGVLEQGSGGNKWPPGVNKACDCFLEQRTTTTKGENNKGCSLLLWIDVHPQPSNQLLCCSVCGGCSVQEDTSQAENKTQESCGRLSLGHTDDWGRVKWEADPLKLCPTSGSDPREGPQSAVRRDRRWGNERSAFTEMFIQKLYLLHGQPADISQNQNRWAQRNSVSSLRSSVFRSSCPVAIWQCCG